MICLTDTQPHLWTLYAWQFCFSERCSILQNKEVQARGPASLLPLSNRLWNAKGKTACVLNYRTLFCIQHKEKNRVQPSYGFILALISEYVNLDYITKFQREIVHFDKSLSICRTCRRKISTNCITRASSMRGEGPLMLITPCRLPCTTIGTATQLIPTAYSI